MAQALNSCDVVGVLRCNPAPDNEMFKQLVLRALINVIEGQGGGAGVILPQVSFAFGAVPVAYTTVGLFDATRRLGRLYIDNQTDADVDISLDGGITTAFKVFANSTLSRELGNYRGVAANSFMFKYDSAAPTTGTIYFDGSY